jgi:hypothetical protein
MNGSGAWKYAEKRIAGGGLRGTEEKMKIR